MSLKQQWQININEVSDMDSHGLKIFISFSDDVFESEDRAVRVCFTAEHTLCQVGAIYIW